LVTCQVWCAHARIQPRGPTREPQCQTCRSSFLKYRTGWFYAHAQQQTCPRIQPGPVLTIQTLLQFFPEIQNMMVYAHAQTCPRILPRGPVRAQQCQSCRSSFLKYKTGWFMRMRRRVLALLYLSRVNSDPGWLKNR
jgi:hypothetical protein